MQAAGGIKPRGESPQLQGAGLDGRALHFLLLASLCFIQWVALIALTVAAGSAAAAFAAAAVAAAAAAAAAAAIACLLIACWLGARARLRLALALFVAIGCEQLVV